MRIVVVGSPCSGKSTFAAQLSALSRIRLTHLDDLYWGPCWSRPDHGTWHKRLQEAVRDSSWIIEGNYAETFPQRFNRATLVIYVKTHACLCLVRLGARVARIVTGEEALLPLNVRGTSARPFAPGDWMSLPRKILTFEHVIEPLILEHATRAKSPLLILRSRADATRAIDQIARVQA
jgi:hypothetical protein